MVGSVHVNCTEISCWLMFNFTSSGVKGGNPPKTLHVVYVQGSEGHWVDHQSIESRLAFNLMLLHDKVMVEAIELESYGWTHPLLGLKMLRI